MYTEYMYVCMFFVFHRIPTSRFYIGIDGIEYGVTPMCSRVRIILLRV